MSHQFVGLLLKRTIHSYTFSISFTHHIIDGREGAVIIDKGPQKSIGRDDLVEHLDLFVLLEKRLAPFRIPEVFDQGVNIPVVEVALDEVQICRRLLLHLALEQQFQQVEVLDDGIHLFTVESECLFQLVEDADEVQNEAVWLHHLYRLVLVGTVHPSDRLQQRVVAHRLVEIHRIEHGRIEAGE